MTILKNSNLRKNFLIIKCQTPETEDYTSYESSEPLTPTESEYSTDSEYSTNSSLG